MNRKETTDFMMWMFENDLLVIDGAIYYNREHINTVEDYMNELIDMYEDNKKTLL